MPSLNESTQLARILQAFKALQNIARGQDKRTACEEAGLSPWQFDKWVAEGGEVIERFQQNIAEAERVRLVNLVNAESVLLNQLIDAATTGVFRDRVEYDGKSKDVIIYRDVDVADQLKVLKFIYAMRQDLEKKHGVHSSTDMAETYLKGPATHIETSKMLESHELSRSNTVNVKPKEDGSVDIHFRDFVERIDGEVRDLPNPETTVQSDPTEKE